MPTMADYSRWIELHRCGGKYLTVNIILSLSFQKIKDKQYLLSKVNKKIKLRNTEGNTGAPIRLASSASSGSQAPQGMYHAISSK